MILNKNQKVNDNERKQKKMSEKPQQDQQKKEQQDQKQTENPDRDTAQKDEQPGLKRSLVKKPIRPTSRQKRSAKKRLILFVLFVPCRWSR